MSKTAEAAAIRSRIEALAQALRDKDVDTLMTHYAPENVTFDLQPPLQVNGSDAYRKNFERWFANIDGSIGYEITDLHITAGDDTAFCHSVCKITSTRINGERANYAARVTSGLRKIGGEWMITHEHVSMPIDMRTMQAAPTG
jgi:ketosteroid isomerase-like protein